MNIILVKILLPEFYLILRFVLIIAEMRSVFHHMKPSRSPEKREVGLIMFQTLGVRKVRIFH